jgi:Cu(I)/Ag(I) efflux system protein CusF
MKLSKTLPILFALSMSILVFAQSGDTKGMEMKGMKGMDMKEIDMKDCMKMKGMDMKGMDADQCHKMMKGMDQTPKGVAATTHSADGIVKLVDPINSKVTLAHGAVKSLGWHAMTMAFAVKDKALLDKLVAGKEAHVEFTKQGNDYVIISVK